MCLGKVLESYEPPSMMITDGWKTLGDPQKPRVQMKVNGKLEVPLDKWIKATAENASGGMIKADDGNKYLPGFHAYSDESEIPAVNRKFAGKYTRVFLRGITCSGMQDGFQVVVADEMYIPSDPNGWPPKGDEKSVPTPPAPSAPPTGGKGVKGLIDKMKGMGVTPGEA